MSFIDRIRSGWNAFIGRDPTEDYGPSYSFQSERIFRTTYAGERSILASINNRISLDCAAMRIEHVRLDDEKRYSETIESRFNRCLTLSANVDQTGRAFIQDAILTMLEVGTVAIVPTDTSIDPYMSESYDIYSLRVGKVTEWRGRSVKVELWNEEKAKKQEVVLDKRFVAIVQNPFYTVMNEPNSTYQRIKRKLAMLDSIDEQTSSGKLDLIIQLPYVVKSKTRKQQAEMRRTELESQLNNSKYGIAYTDSTERIIQLNRALENNLLGQIEYLTNQLYSQIGFSEEILNGKADEQTTLNYYTRIIEPILSALADEMKRKFLTPTAVTQGQSIMFFRDQFKLVPTAQLAELADKMTRNEIMSSNEFRQIIGLKPSSDPEADELRNKNLNKSAEEMNAEGGEESAPVDFEEFKMAAMPKGWADKCCLILPPHITTASFEEPY